MVERSDNKLTLAFCGLPKCQHKWDGPWITTENGGSATCSKCGVDAVTVDLWESEGAPEP